MQVAIGGEQEALVYCAAFAVAVLGDAHTLTSVSEITRQSIVGVADREEGTGAELSVSLDIEGLVPATSYAVHCLAVSLDGLPSTLRAANSKFAAARTLCCKEVVVSLSRRAYRVSGSYLDATTVSIDVSPSSALSLDFAINGSSALVTPAGGAPVVYPAALNFSSATLLPAVELLTVITGAATGAFSLQVSLSGPAAAEYSVVFPEGAELVVLAADVEPPAPSMQAAVFSGDGSSVVLTFSFNTNRAGFSSGFPCNALLAFAGSAAAECLWLDAARIAIYPVYRSSAPEDVLLVGTNITFTQAAAAAGQDTAAGIRAECMLSDAAACLGWATASEAYGGRVGGFIAVEAPPAATAQVPSVGISAPTVIGACSNLTIDLSSSVGAAGRPWSRTSIAALSRTASTTSLAALQAYLDHNLTFSPPSPIPFHLLNRGTTYTFKIELCNFLGFCGSSNWAVQVLNSVDEVSIATVLGSSQRTLLRPRQLSIKANSFVESCDGSRSVSSLQYAWSLQVESAGAAQNIALPSSNSQNPAIFKVPPYSLTVGVQYKLSVVVTSSATAALRASATTYVLVEQSRLVAQLACGSDLALTAGTEATLDASGSYDEDLRGVTGLAAGLTYSWSCQQVLPTFSPECGLSILQQQAGMLTVTAGVGAANSTSRVTVTVFDASRSASASTDVQVVLSARAQLAISSALSSLLSVNTAKTFTLTGRLVLPQACSARWTVDDTSSVQLSESSLTPITVALPAGAHTLNLKLGAGALPQRSTLVFSLSCGAARSSITVATNGAPQPGAFSVTPASGEALSTRFMLSASAWDDADIPLSYEFGFYSGSASSVLTLLGRSEQTYVESVLAAGPPQQGYKREVWLFVYDALDSSESATVGVTVLPIADEVRELEVIEQLVSLAGDGVDANLQLTSVSSAALSTADCSLAPNCSALHRLGCAATAGTCGVCQEGFVGDAGDHNTPCCLPQAAATSDTAACLVAAKSCLGNCSGHGECEFYQVSTGLSLALTSSAQQCLLSDRGCEARCVCHTGFTGIDCSLGEASVAARSLLLGELIDRLGAVTQGDDINEQTVPNWSDILYSFSLNPFLLTAEDAAQLQAIALRTMSLATDLAVIDADMLNVLNALDSLAAAGADAFRPSSVSRRLSPDEDGLVQFQSHRRSLQEQQEQLLLDVVEQFTDLVSDALVLGQPGSERVFRSFRTSSQLIEAPGDKGDGVGEREEGYVSVAAPLSDAEAQAGAVTSAARLSLQPSNRVLRSSTITTLPKQYVNASAFSSQPFYLSIAPAAGSEDTTGQGVEDLVSEVQFTLQHFTGVEGFTYNSSTSALAIATECRGKRNAANHTYTCPFSGEVIRHDCADRYGTLTSYCPVPVPTCSRIDSASKQIGTVQSCRVVAYSAASTTCACNVTVSSSGNESSAAATDPQALAPGIAVSAAGLVGRRLRDTASEFQNVLDESGVTNMVVGSEYVVNQFLETFESAEEFDSLADLRRVLVVILMFSVVWATGLLFACGLMVGAFRQPVQKFQKERGRRMGKIAPTALEARKYLLRYIETLIPPVYLHDQSLTVRVLSEIANHHRYLVMFTKKASDSSMWQRTLVVLKMLTTQTMLMFLLALLYDLEEPGDDGSCESFDSEAACLKRTAIMDNSQPYCEWREETGSSGSTRYTCAYFDSPISTKVFIYLMVIIAIFTACFNTPIDWMFNILAAPTKFDLLMLEERSGLADQQTHHRLSAAAGSALRNVRRASNAAASVAAGAAVGASNAVRSGTSRMGSMLTKQLGLSPAGSGRKQLVVTRDIPVQVEEAHALASVVLPSISARAMQLEGEKDAALVRMKSIAVQRKQQQAKQYGVHQNVKEKGKGKSSKHGASPQVGEVGVIYEENSDSDSEDEGAGNDPEEEKASSSTPTCQDVLIRGASPVKSSTSSGGGSGAHGTGQVAAVETSRRAGAPPPRAGHRGSSARPDARSASASGSSSSSSMSSSSKMSSETIGVGGSSVGGALGKMHSQRLKAKYQPFSRLRRAVLEQRLLLNAASPQTMEFEQQWGLRPDKQRADAAGDSSSPSNPSSPTGLVPRGAAGSIAATGSLSSSTAALAAAAAANVRSGGSAPPRLTSANVQAAAAFAVAAASLPSFHMVQRAELDIAQEVRDTDKQASTLRKELAAYTVQHAGMEILHLFIIDVLGRRTKAAQIFQSKFEEDFESTNLVSMNAKTFAATVLIFMNAFFVYYALLQGFRKGRTWQYQYLNACIVQFFIEVFVFETMECIWLNFVVPGLVKEEVRRAAKVLREAADKVASPDLSDSTAAVAAAAAAATAATTAGKGGISAGQHFIVDAPTYLFVSTKVARAFPTLLESIIVLSYSSHLPGELSTLWRHPGKVRARQRRDAACQPRIGAGAEPGAEAGAGPSRLSLQNGAVDTVRRQRDGVRGSSRDSNRVNGRERDRGREGEKWGGGDGGSDNDSDSSVDDAFYSDDDHGAAGDITSERIRTYWRGLPYRAFVAVGWASAILVVLLQWLGTLPFFYQKVILRIVQPLLLSGATLVWYLAVGNLLYLILLGAGTVSLIRS